MEVVYYDDMDVGGRALSGTSAEGNAGAIAGDVKSSDFV